MAPAKFAPKLATMESGATGASKSKLALDAVDTAAGGGELEALAVQVDSGTGTSGVAGGFGTDRLEGEAPIIQFHNRS